jgi:hypothetical protein
MYNMDISIFGLKISMEILILICIIYLILMIHTVCSCCNVPGIMEALTTMDPSGNVDLSGNSVVAAKVATKVASKKEGFAGANTNYGQSSPYDLSYDVPLDTSKWVQPNLTVTKGQPLSPGVQAILDRPSQPVPLPEGEMLMFANTEFKPECCPSVYSTSTGCACITPKQYNYLVTRGGNNVPYSEY